MMQSKSDGITVSGNPIVSSFGRGRFSRRLNSDCVDVRAPVDVVAGVGRGEEGAFGRPTYRPCVQHKYDAEVVFRGDQPTSD